MICRILLLINLASCFCGMFEPHNKALKYQAVENNNVTVEWCFSSKADISIPSLKIHCVFVVPELKVFYHLDNSVEESQHEQFAGRVQCDKDALRTGRVRLHLSRVRTDDSGLYLCRMATEFGRKVKQFSLNITGTFVVNVTQTSYQAEENNNITLEWMFTTKTDKPLTSISINCEMLTDLKASGLFHLHDGVEVPESQDEQFAGRVQCDKDVLREGRIRLHVSRLRTDDSGVYLCEVSTNYGGNFGECRLSVTAAADEPKPQRPTVRPQPESRGRIGLYGGLGLIAAALLAVCAGLCFAFSLCFIKSTDKKGNVSAAVQTLSFSEKKPIRTNRTLCGGPPFYQNESSELWFKT